MNRSKMIIIVSILALCGVSVLIGLKVSKTNPHSFLNAHGLSKKDTEHVGFIDSLLKATLEKDADGIRGLFAKNAIREISDETMNYMIEDFISYCHFTTYSIVVPISPIADELFQNGRTWKILKGPLELKTDIGEYRLAVKCCVCNEVKPDDVGIWSIYIITKEKDSNQDNPYYGDFSYKTGIYFDVARTR